MSTVSTSTDKVLRGDNYTRVWPFEKEVGGVRTPLDLATEITEARLDLRRRDRDNKLIYRKRLSTNDLTIADTNKLILQFSEAEMAHLNGRYRYELQIHFASGLVKTVKRVDLIVENDTTV